MEYKRNNVKSMDKHKVIILIHLHYYFTWFKVWTYPLNENMKININRSKNHWQSVVTREEMAPTLENLNSSHVHRRLQDTSALDNRISGLGDVELDVAKDNPARQRSRRMKKKNTRLEGYLWEWPWYPIGKRKSGVWLELSCWQGKALKGGKGGGKRMDGKLVWVRVKLLDSPGDLLRRASPTRNSEKRSFLVVLVLD